jgi:hypothetical protein
MTARITQKDLAAFVSRINRVTQSPAEHSTIDAAGQHAINVGHYRISYAYGGASLVRTCNESGGESTVSFGGHIPKRDLYTQMQAYLAGLEDAVGANTGASTASTGITFIGGSSFDASTLHIKWDASAP